MLVTLLMVAIENRFGEGLLCDVDSPSPEKTRGRRQRRAGDPAVSRLINAALSVAGVLALISGAIAEHREARRSRKFLAHP